MDGILSQEEINALLNNTTESLSDSERDAIGEVANISMGSAATTLSTLLNRRVEISTPSPSVVTWDDITIDYERPCIFVRINYTKGLTGTNLLVLKEDDVKHITDLMMGGDGTNIEGELGELHLSAISEAMNQMMGSSSTSLSSMLDRTIDISPPDVELVDLTQELDLSEIDAFLQGRFIRITFRLQIEHVVDSEIMQVYPISFAKEMCSSFLHQMEIGMNEPEVEVTSYAAPEQVPPPEPMPAPQPVPAPAPAQNVQQAMMQQPSMGGSVAMGQPAMGGYPAMGGPPPMDLSQQMQHQAQVNVHPAQFTAFSGDYNPMNKPENIDLIMDVPLEVTVELGRTSKSIQEILEFSPGTIIELNKLAGEPIDILVNDKYVARGEVVVIDENFGIRITEIIKK